MPKPVTAVPTWASDTNYPADAEPEASTATKVAPTSGQATIGWRPDQIPTAQEQNYWMNLIGDYVAWLATKVVSRERAISFADFIVSDNANAYPYFSTAYITGAASGSSFAYAGLPVDVGAKLDSCVVYYDRQSAGGVAAGVYRTALATGVQTAVVAFTATDTTSSGTQTHTLTPAHTVETGYAYYIVVLLQNPANRLYGAKFTYSDDV